MGPESEIIPVTVSPGEDMAVAFLLSARAAAIQAAERSFSEGVQQVFGHLVPDNRKILGFERTHERSFNLKVTPQASPVPTPGE